MLNNAMLSKKAVSHFYTISTQILPKINLGSKSTGLNITVSRKREIVIKFLVGLRRVLLLPFSQVRLF